MVAQTGVKKPQLQRIMRSADSLKKFSEQPVKSFNSRNKRQVGASGAGRKVPIPEIAGAQTVAGC